MNWGDWAVLGIILAFAIIGMMNGFIMSVFRLASYFISIILSIKFYPVVSKFLLKTSLYTSIKASILHNLLRQTPKADSQVKQAAADSIINSLQLPGFMKGTLISHMPSPSKLVDVTKIMDTISGELAKMVIDIISLILLYILIRIALIFLKFILQGIAKLPLFRQIDKLGGFGLGAVEGLLTIYVLFAVLMLFNASPQFKNIFETIDNSLIARFFYQHNFIIDWMFSANKPV